MCTNIESICAIVLKKLMIFISQCSQCTHPDTICSSFLKLNMSVCLVGECARVSVCICNVFLKKKKRRRKLYILAVLYQKHCQKIYQQIHYWICIITYQKVESKAANKLASSLLDLSGNPLLSDFGTPMLENLILFSNSVAGHIGFCKL